MNNKSEKAPITSIKQWNVDERPREKLRDMGKNVLTDAELIAILIATGTKKKSAIDVAKDLLTLANNSLSVLARMSIPDLCKVSGIGPAKAITIIAALEFAVRKNMSDLVLTPKITDSKAAYNIMKGKLTDLNYEEFWIITCNTRIEIINTHRISDGGTSATIVDAKRVFKLALENNASNIFLIHNHPSGSLIPSEADIQLTHKMKNAGNLLDIKVLDHLIISSKGYYSFSDDGKLA